MHEIAKEVTFWGMETPYGLVISYSVTDDHRYK